MERRFASPESRIIFDIIMDQGEVMEKLDYRCGLKNVVISSAVGPAREKAKGGPDAFSSPFHERDEHPVYPLILGFEFRDHRPLDLFEMRIYVGIQFHSIDLGYESHF